MAWPITNLKISTVSRISVKEIGWVDIVPGTLLFTALNFYYDDDKPVDGETFTGLSYLAYTYTEAVTGKTFTANSDGIIAMEYSIPAPPDPEPEPEEPEEGGF